MAYNLAEKRDTRGRWIKFSTLAKDVVEGDRLDIAGKNRVTKVHPRGDQILLATRIKGSRSGSVETHHKDAKIAVYHKVTPEIEAGMQKVVDSLEAEVRVDGGPPRRLMPQLSGVPIPGSKSDKMFSGRPANSEVDLTAKFQDWLNKKGVKVVDTEVPADTLKPSQDELVAGKVLGLAKFMETAPADSVVFEPIFTTADGYVIDGHHRWAANVVRNTVDGTPRNMRVRQIQANRKRSLAFAIKFMDEYGLPRVGVGKFATVSQMVNLSYGEVYVDLAFNPHELRDPKGEWTKSQHTLPGEPSYADVAKAFDWNGMAESGSDKTPTMISSIQQQGNAQIRARTWEANVHADSPDLEQYASGMWSDYQSPAAYGDINATLRNKTVSAAFNSGVTYDRVKTIVQTMFDRGGYKTTEPITLFRALRSGTPDASIASRDHAIDWSKKFQPGDVFTDDGIVSTTAYNRFAQGWLALGPDGREMDEQKPNDVVMEIRVPKGKTIMGGDPGFIETMLPPGSKFKIVKVDKAAKAPHASNPIGNNPISPFTYTHVVAELQ